PEQAPRQQEFGRHRQGAGDRGGEAKLELADPEWMQSPHGQEVERHLVDEVLRASDDVARRGEGREERRADLVEPEAPTCQVIEPDGQRRRDYQGKAGGRGCKTRANLAGCHVADGKISESHRSLGFGAVTSSRTVNR